MKLRKIIVGMSTSTVIMFALTANATEKTQPSQLQQNTYSASVSYSKTELVSRVGVENIYVRIQEAALETCKKEYSFERFVKKRREMNKCLIHVTNELVDSIKSESLNNVNVRKNMSVRNYASK